MRLDPTKGDYDQDCYWVGHPEGGDGDDVSRDLIAHRYEIEILGEVTDDEASYSYDDWALCELRGQYYLLATSGCSCPSPSETWRVEKGPATLEEIRRHITEGDYAGYTMPKRQLSDFLAVIDTAIQEAATS